jgi:hypothetical protein
MLGEVAQWRSGEFRLSDISQLQKRQFYVTPGRWVVSPYYVLSLRPRPPIPLLLHQPGLMGLQNGTHLETSAGNGYAAGTCQLHCQGKNRIPRKHLYGRIICGYCPLLDFLILSPATLMTTHTVAATGVYLPSATGAPAPALHIRTLNSFAAMLVSQATSYSPSLTALMKFVGHIKSNVLQAPPLGIFNIDHSFWASERLPPDKGHQRLSPGLL